MEKPEGWNGTGVGIERKYEGMRAKMKKNFYGRITKASLVGAEFSTDVFMTEPFLVER